MTDLVTTGPPLLELRWGQFADAETGDSDGDGAVERAFYPASHYEGPPGYLHPGVLAAAVLGAAATTGGLPAPTASVSVAAHRLVPLGGDLRAVVATEGGTVRVELHHHGRAATEDDPIDLLATGEVRGGEPTPPPDLGALRSVATVPIPEEQGDPVLAGDFVADGDHPRGLGLVPGWHAPDTVVTAFLASDQMAEGGVLSPAFVAAVLASPTLAATRDEVVTLGAGALLTDYAVTFLRDAPASGALRTVGLAGPTDADTVRGTAALLSEAGDVYAVAQASWTVVDEVPTREAGAEPPASEFLPLRGGRAERAPEGEGQPLPGRREAPGPRSERPGDHDRREVHAPAQSGSGPAGARSTVEQDHGPS